MDRERLFVETMRDLNRKVRNEATDYEVLRSSGLVRQLLIDESPLAEHVNRRQKPQKSITYRYVALNVEAMKKSAMPVPTTSALGFSVDAAEGFPDGLSFAEHAQGSAAHFLRAVVALLEGEPITVRDVVKHTANVAGGIHAGAVRKHEAGQQRLEQLREINEAEVREPVEELLRRYGLEAGPLPGGLQTVRAIGRVVLRGLWPLFLDVAEKLKGPQGKPL